MLSYQHAYHAGNLADVHKHAALAWMLDYLTRKPKPLSYIETHAGRGLYDLGSAEALKTGEARAGIDAVAGWFAPDHPYAAALVAARAAHGPRAYPGSPLIARGLLRAGDRMHLAEMHPQEARALEAALPAGRAGADAPMVRHHRGDGPALALSVAPPEPARGLCLIDPSWEVKAEYETLPRAVAALARKWPVGIVALWYPRLATGAQAAMVRGLRAAHPGALSHEVGFPPAREGHGMVGSGLLVLNPPWGLEAELDRLAGRFAAL